MIRALILFGCLLLAGCGQRATLAPAPGQTLPVAPYGANATPAPEQLLTLPPEARPEPSTELLRRSSPREGDRFDLPPS